MRSGLLSAARNAAPGTRERWPAMEDTFTTLGRRYGGPVQCYTQDTLYDTQVNKDKICNDENMCQHGY